MKRTRVLLADDQTMFVEVLRDALSSQFEVLGTVSDGQSLLAVAKKLNPDVVVLEVSLPRLSGIEAARRLREIVPRAKLVFLTTRSGPTFLNRALAAGASAYVLKRSSRSELLAAITKAVRGERYVTPALGEGVPEAFQKTRRGAGPQPSLTPRQREVLQFVAEGHSSKQIAALLEISTRTVEFHRRRIMERLDLATTAELTRFAIRQGLVSE